MVKRLAFVCTAFGLASIGSAQFVAFSENFGYQGSMVKYGTLADALSSQNSLGSFAFSRRDGSLHMAQNRPDFSTAYPNANHFITCWWYTTEPNSNGLPKDDINGNQVYSGFGNPNNTTDSFVQLADSDGSTRSGGGVWTDGSFTSFRVVSMGAATFGNDLTRLWNGLPNGNIERTRGDMLSYNLDVTFSGLNGQWDGSYFTSTVEPTSVSGTFKGIFRNTSTTHASSNGYYVFDLSIDQSVTPWALVQGNAALNGNFLPSYFSAPAGVPEPASLAALGIGALALLRGRRK